MTMDMLQIFHMNGGEGETSYAKNCAIQAKILSITKACVEAAMQDYHRSCHFPRDTLTIAELGCSSGSTALAAVNQIIDVVEAGGGGGGRTKFLVYMNDLPRNDFNELFTLLPSFHKKLKQERGADFGPCYIAGLPGNFYERLVPNQTLHFVHSSSSLHWLSQAPQGLDGKDDPRTINKGKLYISMDSPRPVIDGYRMQFRKDFTSFLKCRSEEMILGGRLVLSFVGRRSSLPTRDEDFFPWEFIAQALMSMVSEGLVKEELVDSFNVPYYAPCLEEVKTLIEENSSFYGDRFETAEIEWDGGAETESKSVSSFASETGLTKGGKISKLHRAVVESLLEHHFGGEIMDELFLRYAKTLDDVLSNGSNDYTLTNLVVSLIRL